MRIVIISPNEPRNRQKFLSNPLLSSGHQVTVLKIAPVGKFLVDFLSNTIRRRPEIVIVVGFAFISFLSAVIFKAMNVPVVFRFGGNRMKDLKSLVDSYKVNRRYGMVIKTMFNFFVAKRVIKSSKSAIVVNDSLRPMLPNTIESSIYVIPQYIDGDIVPRDYNVTEPIKILTVSNLNYSEKAKGVIRLIKELISYSNATPNICVHFQVAGSGLHFDEVEDFITKTGVPGNLSIELLGFTSQIDECYGNADIFVYDSKHDATPNVILESKRFGLPVLANHCPEFESIIFDGKSGFLFHNPDEFQPKLHVLIHNEELRMKLGNEAQIEHTNNYSITAIGRKLDLMIDDFRVSKKLN